MSDPEAAKTETFAIAGLIECYDACKEFVRKVEARRASNPHSLEFVTYVQMKAAIEHTEGGPK